MDTHYSGIAKVLQYEMLYKTGKLFWYSWCVRFCAPVFSDKSAQTGWKHIYTSSICSQSNENGGILLVVLNDWGVKPGVK